MSKPDEGHELTEDILTELEKKIKQVYGKAAKEMQGTVSAFFEQFKTEDAENREKIGKKINGRTYTKAEYERWRLAEISKGRRLESLRQKLALRLTEARAVAIAYINDITPTIYSLNRNFSTYQIFKALRGNILTLNDGTGIALDFTLWNEQTVRRLILSDPDLMPNYPKRIAEERGFDLEETKKKINAEITSGILQGKSIPQMQDSLCKTIFGKDMVGAIRAARTAATSAQNGGRLDQFYQAEKLGIELEKQWVATLDARTRDSHRDLDLVHIPTHEKFSNGLMRPGDPDGAPAEVYNCRCSMVAYIPKYQFGTAKRFARNPYTGKGYVIDEMSYREWEKMMQEEEENMLKEEAKKKRKA